MPSGSRKRKAAKKQQKGGLGGLHITPSSRSSSPGTDDLKSHAEMGSDDVLKSSHDGERESDGGDVSSPASQDHQVCQFGGGQEEEEGEESKKGGTPHLQAFVDKDNSSEVIGDTLAMGVVDEGLMPENKPLNDSSDVGMLGDDEGDGSNLENETNNLATEPAYPDDSAKKEGSEYAGSVKESHDEEAHGFALEPTSSEDSVKKEESNVKSEYADFGKELCDGRRLGDDQSISMGNLNFEVSEEQIHGSALELASLDNSVKRKESCNGNGEHADSTNVETPVEGEGFKTVIADNEVKKQEACDFTPEFVSSDDPAKMEKSSNTYSGCFDSAKEIHGGTVGDDVAVNIGNLENEVKEEADFISEPTFINNSVKKEEQDIDRQYAQSVMELHNGTTVGVTRNSDDEAKNKEACDLVSEPALLSLHDSVTFGGSVMKEVSQVVESTQTEKACNSIGDTTSVVDSSKLAHSVSEDVNCSSETASIDDHVVLGPVAPVLKGDKNLLGEEFPGVSTDVIGMPSKKNEENVLPLCDEVGRVSSGGMSSASKGNEDKPLCPSDHSGVPIVETSNVSENIKDSEEANECSEHQPLVNSAPPPVKTSWKSCCGLFSVLTGSA